MERLMVVHIYIDGCSFKCLLAFCCFFLFAIYHQSSKMRFYWRDKSKSSSSFRSYKFRLEFVCPKVIYFRICIFWQFSNFICFLFFAGHRKPDDRAHFLIRDLKPSRQQCYVTLTMCTVGMITALIFLFINVRHREKT